MNRDTIQIYRTWLRRWRWVRMTGHGERIARSAKSYATPSLCAAAAGRCNDRDKAAILYPAEVRRAA